MVFVDLIEVPTPNNENTQCMHEKYPTKILNNACPWMHQNRRAALTEVILAAIGERRLSETGLGRAIDSDAREKHCIKRADRLIGNAHLYREFPDIYSPVISWGSVRY